MSIAELGRAVSAAERRQGVYNVKSLGAKGDGVTDDTAAFNAAIAAMPAGSKLITPPGAYKITNVIFNPPDDCIWECQGTLISAATGVAVSIGDMTTNRYRYRVLGLKVKSPTRNWASGRVGVRVVNTYACYIDLRNVYGFERNVEVVGSGTGAGLGCAYNEFHFGTIIDGKKLLYLRAELNGWCNENSLYGGEFNYTSDVTDPTGCVALTVEHNAVHGLNNNRFVNNSFEGTGSTTILTADMAGSFNAIYHPRMEAIGKITLNANSQYAVVFFGYTYDNDDNVDDQGSYSKVYGNFRTKWVGGPSDVNLPQLDLVNAFGTSAKVIGVRDPSKNLRFYVLASGQIFSNQHGYFETGIRFSTSDATYTDRGIFAGNGSPEGVVTAQTGSLYLNKAGGTGTTLYVKEAGAGNTGWIAK